MCALASGISKHLVEARVCAEDGDVNHEGPLYLIN
jgi:hypothetical protein